MSVVPRQLFSKASVEGAHCDVGIRRADFRQCKWHVGSLGAAISDPENRLTFEDITIKNCLADAVVVGPNIFRSIEIDGLKTLGVLWIRGAVFRHCVLRGRIGRISISELARNGEAPDSARNLAFLAANTEFYDRTDWALDITEARCDELDLRGVPVHLVRTDPDRQVRVSYRRADAALAENRFAGVEEDIVGLLRVNLRIRAQSQSDFIMMSYPGHRRWDGMRELFRVLRAEGLAIERS